MKLYMVLIRIYSLIPYWGVYQFLQDKSLIKFFRLVTNQDFASLNLAKLVGCFFQS